MSTLRLTCQLSHRLGLAVLAATVAVYSGPLGAALTVSPLAIVIDRPEGTQQLLVTDVNAKVSPDLTRVAQYQIDNDKIARVDAQGLVVPIADGETIVHVLHGTDTERVTVRVVGVSSPSPVSFQQEIVPLLTKAGCNSGGCHGKAEGQNGFKLSVFGFDIGADYDALTKEGRGRRVFPAAPDHSLLLRKATATVPHGGGLRVDPDSRRYKWLRRWIAEGAMYRDEKRGGVIGLEIEPKHVLLSQRGTQQLRVTALDAEGRRCCVTTDAGYSSNAAPVVDVDPRGWIQANNVPGEAAILVRYMGQVAICLVTVPKPGVKVVRPSEANFVDKLVWDKLELLGVQPSAMADDAVFMRRVFLDTIGTLPTADEARHFLARSSADKRTQLIDELLARDEYADYWAMRWSDILRVDRDKLTAPGAVAVSRWLRRQFAENRPYDEIVRSILTAQGSTAAEGPAAIYLALDTPEVLCRSVSQLFLGVRIECAQCHHHPFERWGQEDFFALAGFFSGVKKKNLPSGAEAITSSDGEDLKHPRTEQRVAARALAAPPAVFEDHQDRREKLAEWMTTPSNPFFARSFVNRLWAHYFGRGLVEPIDDLRVTNPATNAPLLDELSRQFVASGYDIKQLTKTLLTSRVYQLSSQFNQANVDDLQNFSHASIKALPAEVLLDAVCHATSVGEQFNGWPAGYRAIQVWDNRMPSYFMQIFGRPVRASVCECERSSDPSISQALHLMNSPEILAKISHREGVARRLASSAMPAEAIIDELFLHALSRFPSATERAALSSQFTNADGLGRRAAVEDVLWAILNSKEFVYNH